MTVETVEDVVEGGAMMSGHAVAERAGAVDLDGQVEEGVTDQNGPENDDLSGRCGRPVQLGPYARA